MESIQSNEARTRWSEILRAVDKGEHVEIRRYLTPLAVMVPGDWYEDIDALLADLAALAEYRERAEALRRGREAAGLGPGYDRVVHHVDGNPYNNDPANLRVVDPKEASR